MRRRLSVIVLLLALTMSAFAQEEMVSIRPSQVTTVVKTDHNPTTALLLSLVPGGGQIYNRQAWKAPLFYVALGGVGYMAYNYYSQMRMFKTEYLAIGYDGSSTLPDYQGYPGSSIYNMYQSANKNFQTFCIVVAAVYGLNLLDAYVFGHLYDFNVSDDLTMHIGPSLSPCLTDRWSVAPSINMSFTF